MNFSQFRNKKEEQEPDTEPLDRLQGAAHKHAA